MVLGEQPATLLRLTRRRGRPREGPPRSRAPWLVTMSWCCRPARRPKAWIGHSPFRQSDSRCSAWWPSSPRWLPPRRRSADSSIEHWPISRYWSRSGSDPANGTRWGVTRRTGRAGRLRRRRADLDPRIPVDPYRIRPDRRSGDRRSRRSCRRGLHLPRSRSPGSLGSGPCWRGGTGRVTARVVPGTNPGWPATCHCGRVSDARAALAPTRRRPVPRLGRR